MTLEPLKHSPTLADLIQNASPENYKQIEAAYETPRRKRRRQIIAYQNKLAEKLGVDLLGSAPIETEDLIKELTEVYAKGLPQDE